MKMGEPMPVFDRLGGETDQRDFQIFREQHGGKQADWVVTRGWYLFDDLARLGVSTPVVYPSPRKDSDEEYGWRKVFLLTKSDDAQEAYETLKVNLEKTGLDARQGGWGLPSDWSQLLENLKKLKRKSSRTRRRFLQFTKKERDKADDRIRREAESRSKYALVASGALANLQGITGETVDDSE
jgi:hypothetical protein